MSGVACSGAPSPRPEAPIADHPFAAYVTAAGGRAMEAVDRLLGVGVSFTPADTGNRRLTLELARPANYRQREAVLDRDSPRFRTLIGYNGSVGWWAGNTMLAGAGRSPDPEVRQQAVTAAARQNLINVLAGVAPHWLSGAGVEATPLGAVADGPDRGAQAWALSMSGAPVGRLIVDASTHLPIRIVVPYLTDIRPEGGEYSLAYHEYRDTGDGVRLPFRFTRSQWTGTETGPRTQWLLSAWRVNPSLPPDAFVPPGTVRP